MTTRLPIHSLFEFKSSAAPYIADAAVVCCFDQRIRRLVGEFLREKEILRPDMIVIAGGALTLAAPRTEFDRDFVLEQIRLAVRLHQAKRALLMSHSDCATYGGLAAFNQDQNTEATHHVQQLRRAAAVVRAMFPDLLVQLCFVTFNGVFGVEEQEIQS
jgi:carbonic anhydrase